MRCCLATKHTQPTSDGAYSFLPLLEKERVQNRHWLDRSEFLQVVATVASFLLLVLTNVHPALIILATAAHGGLPARP
jgi:chromate transport protein ChrA